MPALRKQDNQTGSAEARILNGLLVVPELRVNWLMLGALGWLDRAELEASLNCLLLFAELVHTTTKSRIQLAQFESYHLADFTSP